MWTIILLSQRRTCTYTKRYNLLVYQLKGIVHSLQYFYWLRCNTACFCTSVLCYVIRRRVMEILDILWGYFFNTAGWSPPLVLRFSGVWICWWRIGAQATCHPYSYCCKAQVQSSRQHNPKGYIGITRHSIHVELKHEFGTILTGYCFQMDTSDNRLCWAEHDRLMANETLSPDRCLRQVGVYVMI